MERAFAMVVWRSCCAASVELGSCRASTATSVPMFWGAWWRNYVTLAEWTGIVAGSGYPLACVRSKGGPKLGLGRVMGSHYPENVDWVVATLPCVVSLRSRTPSVS